MLIVVQFFSAERTRTLPQNTMEEAIKHFRKETYKIFQMGVTKHLSLKTEIFEHKALTYELLLRRQTTSDALDFCPVIFSRSYADDSTVRGDGVGRGCGKHKPIESGERRGNQGDEIFFVNGLIICTMWHTICDKWIGSINHSGFLDCAQLSRRP